MAKAKETTDVLTGRPTNQADSSSAGLDGQATPAEVKPKRTGPVIEMKNFVGVFNIPPKQKAYMYDRAVEVTKEQIRLMQEMAEEEKIPMYNFREDEKDKDDQGNKKKEKRINHIAEDEVEKIVAKP